MIAAGRRRMIESMAEPQDIVDDEYPEAEAPEPAIFDVGRWAEAYLAELPDVQPELVGVPLS